MNQSITADHDHHVDQARRAPRRARSAAAASLRDVRAAVRCHEDRYVAVPGDGSPAVRRIVRRLRSMQSAHPQAFLEAHHHLDKSLGALNTVVLLVSSFTMVMAVHSAAHQQAEGAADLSGDHADLRRNLPGREVLRVQPQVPRRTAAGHVLFAQRRSRSRTSSSSSASTS